MNENYVIAQLMPEGEGRHFDDFETQSVATFAQRRMSEKRVCVVLFLAIVI